MQFRPSLTGSPIGGNMHNIFIGAVLSLFTVVPTIANAQDYQECQEALEEAASAGEELAAYARRLMHCADSGDFSDDCSYEFRLVKNAQYDYESAASNANSECDDY